MNQQVVELRQKYYALLNRLIQELKSTKATAGSAAIATTYLTYVARTSREHLDTGILTQNEARNAVVRFFRIKEHLEDMHRENGRVT